MVEINYIINTLKITWICRIYLNNDVIMMHLYILKQCHLAISSWDNVMQARFHSVQQIFRDIKQIVLTTQEVKNLLEINIYLIFF